MFRDKLKNLLSKNNRYENSDKYENEESLKEIENKENIGNDKKKIENLVFFVILLIITIVIINYIWNGSEKTNKNETTNDTSKQLAQSISGNNGEINGIGDNTENGVNIAGTNNSNTISNLENKLKNILSKIQGVGDVEVCLNYSESSEVVAMYNENSTTSTTEETDDTGGTRKIEEIDTQKDVIYKEEDGIKTPITAKVVEPKIEGAIITAKGANNSEIKNNIIQAVEAITGLATHKIQVFEMQ